MRTASVAAAYSITRRYRESFKSNTFPAEMVEYLRALSHFDHLHDVPAKTNLADHEMIS